MTALLEKKNSLRIAIAVSDIASTGGIERFVAHLSNYLAQQGHEIYCFTLSPQGTAPRFEYHENIHFISYIHKSNKQAITALHQKLRQNNPDILIVPSSFKEILVWCAALVGTDIPLLYSEHNDPWIIMNERWSKRERESVLWFADNIHLLMPTFTPSVPDALQHKARAIYNPISLSLPQDKEAAPSTEKTILSLGRLEATAKQIRLLIAAFALLVQDFPQWKVDIWGTGPDENALREQISALPQDIQQRVRLCGLTKAPSKQYRSANIFCIPSRFEGCPLTVTEAMSLSLPVVGFADCHAVSALVHHEKNGLLAPEMTAESLAGELRRLMQDAELRQSLGRQAKKDSQNLAPDCIYPQWEELIYTTASKKGQPQHHHIYDENIPENERPYQATMHMLLKRRNIRKDVWYRHRLRKWIRKHPTHADIINGTLCKLGLAIID